MKSRINLLEDFRSELHRKIPSKRELISRIAGILNIDKELASRRLSGSVSFSVDEVGKLAKELGMSVDSLLTKDTKYKWRRYALESPWSTDSLDPIAGMMERYLDKNSEIGSGHSEFGHFFSELSAEFFADYPCLSKFMLFKWGYYYLGYEKFHDYNSFETPERIQLIGERFRQPEFTREKTLIIWDEALIWILCREIRNFQTMLFLDRNQAGLIKEELHTMLTALETRIRNSADAPDGKGEHAFYISNIHIGINGWYHISDNGSMCHLYSNFAESDISETHENALAVREWITSLRKVSSLISGSGQKERRQFFQEQHKITDQVLGDL